MLFNISVEVYFLGERLTYPGIVNELQMQISFSYTFTPIHQINPEALAVYTFLLLLKYFCSERKRSGNVHTLLWGGSKPEANPITLYKKKPT